MTVGSVLSGIGGWDAGFRQAGATLAWQVEVAPARQAILRRRFAVPLGADVRTFRATPVDVLVGAFPAAVDDGLLGALRRVVAEAGPRFVVFETTHRGRALAARALLAEAGYTHGAVPALFGVPALTLNWIRVLIVGSRAPHPAVLALDDPATATVVRAGTLTPEADGTVWLRSGLPRRPTEADLEAVEAALGFAAGWTAGAPRAARAAMLAETTAVPVVRDVADWLGGLA